MSDIDFQNGYLCGLASKGLTKVYSSSGGAGDNEDFHIYPITFITDSKVVYPNSVTFDSTYNYVDYMDTISFTYVDNIDSYI